MLDEPEELELSDTVWEAIRTLVADLAEGRYDAICERGQSPRCSAEELRGAVLEYRSTILPLPDVARPQCYAVKTVDGTIAVDVPMWTVEEGGSDLTLQVEVVLPPDGGAPIVTIDDLHVL